MSGVKFSVRTAISCDSLSRAFYSFKKMMRFFPDSLWHSAMMSLESEAKHNMMWNLSFFFCGDDYCYHSPSPSARAWGFRGIYHPAEWHASPPCAPGHTHLNIIYAHTHTIHLELIFHIVSSHANTSRCHFDKFVQPEPSCKSQPTFFENPDMSQISIKVDSFYL